MITVEDGEKCAICQDVLLDVSDTRKGCILDCLHKFHFNCMQELAEFQTGNRKITQCPMCRCIAHVALVYKDKYFTWESRGLVVNSDFYSEEKQNECLVVACRFTEIYIESTFWITSVCIALWLTILNIDIDVGWIMAIVYFICIVIVWITVGIITWVLIFVWGGCNLFIEHSDQTRKITEAILRYRINKECNTKY
jgi:Zinc finger, C3HC4 type (RING finger)